MVHLQDMVKLHIFVLDDLGVHFWHVFDLIFALL